MPEGKIRTFVRWLLLPMALVVVGMTGFNWMMEAFLHSRDEVVVPPLVGKPLGEALHLLSQMRLTLVEERVEYDESFPAGVVLRQKPASGMKVRQGRAIRVVISRGGQRLFVPDVLKKSVLEAQATIVGTGLALGEVSEAYSTMVSRGLVMGQIPQSGEIAAKDSLVDLKVSKGKPPDNVKLMPEFRNKSVEEVRAWAKQENYLVGVQESSSTVVALSGLVLEQDPLPDQTLEPGAMIRVVTSPLPKTGAPVVPLRYEVPKGTDKVQIRMVARDERGEHEIFKGERNPGDAVIASLSPNGPTRVRIFLNDVLVDERIIGEK